MESFGESTEGIEDAHRLWVRAAELYEELEHKAYDCTPDQLLVTREKLTAIIPRVDEMEAKAISRIITSDERLIVYCRAYQRSAEITAILEAEGF